MNAVMMKNGLFFVILAVTLSLQCGERRQTTIRIYGSTTIEPFMAKAIREFRNTEKIQFMVNAVGSKRGIDSLIDGKCDIAMSSMEILPEQTARARKKGVSIKPFLLAYDIIVPIVHPSNKVSDIKFEDLKKVYERKIRRWSALGGGDAVIDVVERSAASGTHEVWHHYVTPCEEQGDSCTVMPTNSSVLAYVSQHSNAIGYISNAFMNPEVKALKLDGIAITENDSLVTEYHLKRPLYLYVNEEKFDADRETKNFVVFMVINERGRKLIRESGFFYLSWAGQYHPELP
jgi:phosphate transport system substrate-binding protein